MEASEDLLLSTSRFEREFEESAQPLKAEIDFEGRSISSDIPLNYILSNDGWDPKRVVKEVLPNVTDTFLLRGVLSEQECLALQQACFGDGTEVAASSHPVLWRKWATDPSKEYAKLGIRAIRSSPQVAEALWARIAPHIPQHMTVVSKTTGKAQRWEVMPCGLHERQRFVIYEPGQNFPPHTDAPRVIDDRTRSYLTVLFYLGKGGSLFERDKDFRGGELNLLRGDPVTHKTELLHTIPPDQGMVVVFPHMQLHEGKTLKSGRKCAIRNDILYRLVEGEAETAPEPVVTGFMVEEGQH